MASAKQDPVVASDGADSLSERLQTLVAYASTVFQDPSSTVNPPREPSNDASRAALEAFEELGELLRTKAQHGLVTERTLGEGGMGVVRLARQVALDRPVAVKTLKDAVRSREMSLELLREAWITGSLEHPNVVPVYDLAMDPEGGPAIVLKRIEGVVWRDMLQDPEAVRQRFGAGDLLDWNLRTLISVCNAVAFAHERGIVHRDLKPENVMLGRFGEVYVLDWGIAVTTRADNPRLPHASEALAMAGTPHYMAPEMLGDPLRPVGSHSDIYLLGATLFEVLTGRPPHHGSTLTEMIASIITSECKLSEDIPGEIADVCRRAMAREPADRFPSVEGFRDAVEEFLHHRGSLALTHIAEANHRQLRAASAAGASVEELYARLGECRFGYRAALSSWPENRAARRGLNAVLVELAEHELALHKPHAAAMLLAECPDRPEELSRRVDQAQELANREEQRLGQLQLDNDVTVGRRTRLTLMGMLGAVWTCAPLAAHVYAERFTARIFAGSAVAMLVFSIILGVWARDSMNKTLMNRRLQWTVLTVILAQLALGLMALSGLVQLREVLVLLPVFFTMGSAMVSIWLEPRLWPSTAIGFLSIGLALIKPEWTFLGFSAYSLVLTASVVSVWYRRKDLSFARDVIATRARPS